MFCPTASIVGLVQRGKAARARRHWRKAIAAVSGCCRPWPRPDCRATDAELHYGIVAPAGTPPPVIAELNAALNEALADADCAQPARASTAPKRCRARRRLTPPTSPTKRPNGRPSSKGRREGTVMLFSHAGAKFPCAMRHRVQSVRHRRLSCRSGPELSFREAERSRGEGEGS